MTRDRIVINDPDHGVRIASLAGVVFNTGVDQVISRVLDGRLLGGVIFNGYTRASINLHMAGFDDKWANRDLIWCVFHYAFVQLGVKKVFGQVPASNNRALAVNKKLGFKEEARISDVFEDGDLVVVAMYKEDCRWLDLRPRGLTYAGGTTHGRQGFSTRTS